MKACASRASEYLADAPETPGAYWERLELLREKTGVRRKKRTRQVKKYHKYPQRHVSRTDPESGRLNRPGKPKGPHYLCHTSQDTDHGIILDVVTTPGNANDNTPYLEQLERIHRQLIPIQAATADAAYDFPLAHRVLEELGVSFYARPQAHGDCASDKFQLSSFTYEEAQDRYLYPAGNALQLNALRRGESGLYWVYLGNKQDCSACLLRARCLIEGDKRGNLSHCRTKILAIRPDSLRLFACTAKTFSPKLGTGLVWVKMPHLSVLNTVERVSCACHPNP